MSGKGETIAAISTANGNGGVAIVRVSGPDALPVAEGLFRPSGKTPVRAFEPYRMYPGQIVTELFTDYGLCVYFRGSHSYTGEDTVELNCHGGRKIAEGILRQAFALGARPAEAGEFTKRAFLNGKINLSAAEGIVDMINASSESMVRAGYSLYRNELGSRVKGIQDRLRTLLAGIEAAIDYPEEDLPDTDSELVGLRRTAGEICDELEALASSYERCGRMVKSGIGVAIVGLPNAGKSSFLNAVLGNDKAIVSDIKGTTRDVIDGELLYEGVLFRFYDTAGLCESSDSIERIGIERARKVMEGADIVLHIVDGSQPPRAEDGELRRLIGGQSHVWRAEIINKQDILSPARKNTAGGEAGAGVPVFSVSALTGENIAGFLGALYGAVSGQYAPDSGLIVEERHYRAVRDAISCLARVRDDEGTSVDWLTVDIEQAWRSLGEITGETASEDIIGEIFSKFCVGK